MTDIQYVSVLKVEDVDDYYLEIWTDADHKKTFLASEIIDNEKLEARNLQIIETIMNELGVSDIEELPAKIAELEKLRARIAAQDEQIENADDKLQEIISWCRAYPIDVFIEPTHEQLEKANDILDFAHLSLTAITASSMRHVISGVERISNEVRAALKHEQ